MSATAKRAPFGAAHEAATRIASRRALKLPLRLLTALGVVASCIAVSAATAAITIESPVDPLASRTLRLEHAESMALTMAPPAKDDWKPDVEAMLPVTGEAHECLKSAAPPAC